MKPMCLHFQMEMVLDGPVHLFFSNNYENMHILAIINYFDVAVMLLLIYHSQHFKSECSVSTQPKNADIVGNMNTIGAEILYTCEPGYVNEGKDGAECLPSGLWSEQPSCVAGMI